MRISAWSLALFAGSALFAEHARAEYDEDGEDEGELVDDESLQDEAEEGEDLEDGEVLLTQAHLRNLHGKFDKDSNGKVSFAELVEHGLFVSHSGFAGLSQMFSDLDTDKDGQLSLSEHLAAAVQPSDDEEETEKHKEFETEKYRAADLNSDGLLSADEARALFFPILNEKVLAIETAESLRVKDKDGDGKLTEEEFFEVEDMEQEGPDKEERESFADLDTNKDGFIDVAELQVSESGRYHIEKTMQDLLKVADTDKDGHLTSEELAAAHASLTDPAADENGAVLDHLIQVHEHHEHGAADEAPDRRDEL
mmetsp:Transcript_98431/g.275660  ORF Transcript_98431/g.275660 Transcript_98431/m.275660 type:complete len:310 (-) Transcript_98431:209-1138(-)